MSSGQHYTRKKLLAWTKPKLIKEGKKYNLQLTGTKNEMINKLLEAMNNQIVKQTKTISKSKSSKKKSATKTILKSKSSKKKSVTKNQSPVKHNNNINSVQKHAETSTEYEFDTTVYHSNSDEFTRLSEALKYYSRLDIINNNKHRDLFTNFMQQTYKCFVDDFTTLVKISKEDLYKIKESLMKDGSFEKCDIRKCEFATRHGNINSDNSNNKNPLDPILDFYKMSMDSLHFYIFHMFDCGLRTIVSNDNNDEIKQESKSSEYFDDTFARVCKKINEKTDNTVRFGRFRNNNKFNIMIDNNNSQIELHMASGQQGITYMDELCKYLVKKGVDQNTIAVFQNIIVEEEYDSVSISEDIVDQINDDMNDVNSNILKMITDRKCSNCIKRFIQDSQKSMSSFNIGLRFYYWEYYSKIQKIDDDEQHHTNINDHSNYDICELYVDKKYDTFKEEISNYKYITFKQYIDSVTTKATIYTSSMCVKRSCSGFAFETHYNIRRGSRLSFNHLVSLILYTDFSKLCSDFSGTFRKQTHYETISSIKARNSEYYWMSRTLRETVEVFGITKEKTIYESLKGERVYTGISVVMAIPKFRIRLCAPTSTSVHEEVAIKFNGRDAMIVELQIPYGYNNLRTFDCSWISRYKEEDERLYFGGHWWINIQTVIIRQTNENFGDCFVPLLYLDAVFGGSGILGLKRIPIKTKHVKMLSHLMEWKLGQCQKVSYPQYIYDTFECFCKHKKQIHLYIVSLNQQKNNDIVKLVMNDIEYTKDDSKDKRDITDKTNQLRKRTLDIFENVNSIIYKECTRYPLSLLRLLTLIDSCGIDHVKIEAFALIGFQTGSLISSSNWIKRIGSSTNWVNNITKKYKEKNYKFNVSKSKTWNIEINKLRE